MNMKGILCKKFYFFNLCHPSNLKKIEDLCLELEVKSTKGSTTKKIRKKKSRAKTRKGSWQTLGFKAYQHYLIAIKSAQLGPEDVTPEEKKMIRQMNHR